MWILWAGWLFNSTADKFGGFIITSICTYHYAQMQYRSAAQFAKSSPCTNVPNHCPICPSSVFQVPQTIWKYNALFHLASEHSTGTTPPTITGQLLVDIFVSKEEEKASKFEEEVTDLYRMHHNIPDTDGLLEMRKNGKKERDQTQFLQFHQTNLAPKSLR